MGDILHALPAMTSLRLAHPSWVIGWVVEPRWQALLAAEGSKERSDGPGSAQPLVDRIHLADTKGWRERWAGKAFGEITTLRRTLKDADYDVMIDLQGLMRSSIIGGFAGCRRRIGREKPREWLASWFYTDPTPLSGAHVIDQNVELVASIAGDELEAVQPWIPVDPACEAWADEFMRKFSGCPVILINPGAGWGAKRWPFERYSAVARELSGRGFRIVVNCGPGEEPIAASIAQGSGSGAALLNCTVGQLIAITRRVSLVIAGDTGPLHLACALGIPVVGIYGPTDPERNGPYGVPFKVLRSPESRRDHTRRSEPEAGLLTIQSADVLHAAEELLYPSESAR